MAASSIRRSAASAMAEAGIVAPKLPDIGSVAACAFYQVGNLCEVAIV